MADEELELASITRILQYSKPEWPFTCVGMFFSVLTGILPVLLSIFVSEVLAV